MKLPSPFLVRTFAFGALLTAVALSGLTGCSRLRVTTMQNWEVVDLQPADVLALMHRAGFSDEEILQVGADLRNALATQGAARIRKKDRTEAMFAVHVPYVHVSTRDRGCFIYDMDDKAIH
ncbi:MAG: hypothetical protein NTW86_13010 [Candidatus Sumerlaeota bacterium]|nr:hypothetical protein [Candidatus Sumerlaeota bacterium]